MAPPQPVAAVVSMRILGMMMPPALAIANWGTVGEAPDDDAMRVFAT